MYTCNMSRNLGVGVQLLVLPREGSLVVSRLASVSFSNMGLFVATKLIFVDKKVKH